MSEGSRFEVEFYALVDGKVTMYAAGSRAEVEAASKEAGVIDANQDVVAEGLSEGRRSFYAALGESAGIDIEVTKLATESIDRSITQIHKGFRAGLPRKHG